LDASPGQRVNITMWDFTTVDERRLSASSSLYGSSALARPPPAAAKRPRKTNDADDDDVAAAALFVEPGVTCRKYAVVQDGDRQLTLCAGSRRLAGSYESRDSSVKVWIVAGVAPTDRQRFLLRFRGLCLSVCLSVCVSLSVSLCLSPSPLSLFSVSTRGVVLSTSSLNVRLCKLVQWC